ncbi:hypothetical protein [Sphingomonas sp. Leaf62]|uniref:hypothetical protein n=1 Tax=Sphingomonas sp. Leaf62 TaxID=1736228 RepID=UPI0006F2B06B|nr:hypothetical protein [Sphingomonas sp. Leaf62]KQN80538.1 hypothetical protein ASE91_11130 [Sphingomonas sp. Leaf62]
MIDADDRRTQQRLVEVLKREEARRSDADIGEKAQRNRQLFNAAAFEALRLHDEWPDQDERGYFTVSDAALKASGLSRADLDTPAAQTVLEAIGFSQVDRLDPVINDWSGQSPFRVEDGAIRLDDRFPPELRDDVARWSDHLPFRALVSRVWPALREAVALAPAVPTSPSVATEGQRNQPVEDLLAAIAGERHYLAREQGVPIVEPRLLARFGLSPTDVAGDDVRKRIAGLADRQAAEVSQIAIHLQTSPHDLVPDGDGWRLVDDAPPSIRMLVAAWRNDATIQQALGRAVAARPVEAPARSVAEPVGTQPGAAWRRARASRDRAMAAGDAIERRDGNGLTQPGRRIARPGAEETARASPVARRFRGLPDLGLGG